MQLVYFTTLKMKVLLQVVIVAAVFCFAHCGNEIEVVAEKLPKISIEEHTRQFINELRTDLRNDGRTRAISPRLQTIANDYADKLFEHICDFMIKQGYDPMELPDVINEFKALFVTGELSFKKGWLSDICVVGRHGDAIVKYEHKIATFKVPMKFKRLQFSYDYRAKFMGLGPSGGLEGVLKDVDTYVDFAVDIYDPSLHLQVFEIKKTGKVSLKWTGHPLLDWMANIFTKVCVTFFKGIIVKVLSEHCGDIIHNLLNKINKDLENIFQ